MPEDEGQSCRCERQQQNSCTVIDVIKMILSHWGKLNCVLKFNFKKNDSVLGVPKLGQITE